MDAEAGLWQQVRNRFLAAIELEGHEREAWLERLRSTSPEVWHEVVSLLEAHTGSDGVLDKVAADFLSQDTLGPAEDRWSGRQIGAYVVIGLLGRGGMGEVYRARRADAQYEKEVAIKVVRSGFDTRDILDRFRAERQILAHLEHPNIARLLDGGTSSDGLPYLVMELVEGERIEAYCDRERLSVDARLRLFRRVCDAVQFAHQRLVIHRDLKTSNILVTAGGEPKLLDFGVAKLLRSADAATETTLFRPLTPAYASPEQIRGEPLTTASDVFSLGVILREMLIGPRFASTLGEAEALEHAREGFVPPTFLELQLPKEVRAILARALEIDPNRRFPHATALAYELRRVAFSMGVGDARIFLRSALSYVQPQPEPVRVADNEDGPTLEIAARLDDDDDIPPDRTSGLIRKAFSQDDDDEGSGTHE